jgi:hypothetical protein
LALPETFEMEFRLGLQKDESGNLEAFSLFIISESEKRLEAMRDAENEPINEDLLIHDATGKKVDDLYPKRLAEKADAMRMMFKHVPGPFDLRWEGNHSTSFAFFPGETARVDVGDQKLRFSYYAGGGFHVGTGFDFV